MCNISENVYFVRFDCRYEKNTTLDIFLLSHSENHYFTLTESSDYYSGGTVLIPDDEIKVYEELKCDNTNDLFLTAPKYASKCIQMDGYCHSLFKYILNLSPTYRNLVLFNFYNSYANGCKMLNVKLRVKTPSHHIIDYKWNFMLLKTCVERKELEVAMSWLSTLGGAFSSLGDNFEYCAITAGKISAQQFNLAMRLGDPTTVVRCKLYLAISLIQRRKFRLACRIVRSQYAYIHSFRVVDKRLVSMCLGIWSKLKYERASFKSRGIR